MPEVVLGDESGDDGDCKVGSATNDPGPSQLSRIYPQDFRLLNAARDGDYAVLRRLLDAGASPQTKNADGQTALHLAVKSGHRPIVQLLLDNGVNLEAANVRGDKALYVATQLGDFAMVELLLYFKADVESLNPESGHTAFYQAALDGHVAIAKILRENGADVDVLDAAGRTPLFSAVFREDMPIIEFLLQNGANRKIRDETGSVVEDYVSEDTPIMKLLRSDQVLQGPSISESKPTFEPRFTLPFLAADQVDKLNACHGFEATIVDFFIGETEQRIQKTASIWEILYGKGPEAIMKAAAGTKMKGKQQSFRWYHLPANNIEWVDLLASRHFGERGVNPVTLDGKLKAELALSNSAEKQYRASTAHSSFMRPQCRKLKAGPEFSLGKEEAEQVMLFIPYLHFETYRGYQRMIQLINSEKDRATRPNQPLIERSRPIGHRQKSKHSTARPIPAPPPEISTTDSTSSDEGARPVGPFARILQGKGGLKSAFRNARSKLKSRSNSMAKAIRADQSPQPDLERGTNNEKLGGEVVEAQPIAVYKTSPNQNDPEHEEKTIKTTMSEVATQSEIGNPAAMMEETKSEALAELDPSPSGILLQTLDELAEVEGRETNNATHASQPEVSTQTRQPHSAASAQISNGEALSLEQDDPRGGRNLQTLVSAETRSASETHHVVQNLHSPSPEPSASTLIAQNNQSVDQRFVHFPKERAGKSKAGNSHVTEDGDIVQALSGTEQAKASQPPKIARYPRRQRIPLAKLDEHLVKGYLSPQNPGDSPLQIRRTLDQYFYTHLANTSERDGDQVIYRYTRATSAEPKIFMVDQLWLWILNDDTIISCCPQRWDIWSGDDTKATKSALRPPGGARNLVSKSKLSGVRVAERDGGAPPPPPSGSRIAPSITTFPAKERRASEVLEQSSVVTPAITLQSAIQPLPLTVGPLLNLSAKTKQEEYLPLDTYEYITPPKSKKKKAGEGSGMLGWMSGKTSKSIGEGRSSKRIKDWAENIMGEDVIQAEDGLSSRSSSLAEKRKRLAFLQKDPLNVHQLVLKHLQGSARAPITSVDELGVLITNVCIGLFDQHQVPNDFQFFDFFEHSIGDVAEKEAQCFRSFARSLDQTGLGNNAIATDTLYSITAETKLLVEIKDIRDELGILHMVLADQLKPSEDFTRIIGKRKQGEQDEIVEIESLKAQNKVVESHFYRIEKMEKLAKKTYQALNHLLDLKQKQANVSEALSARRQAEQAYSQAKDAKDLTKQSLDQATAARKQAYETTRQGRTVLVFTVITIIFLPLSFMAAFFAINIDSFPSNADGKLSMNFVLTYMLSISSAISIPFILIAFNQDRIAEFLKENKKTTMAWGSLLLGVIILLSIIWTRNLASGIKAGVTVTFILIVVAGLIGQGVHWLVSTARQGAVTTATYMSNSQSTHSIVDD